MNGSIFQNFPKCEPKKSFEKFGNFVQYLTWNWSDWHIEWITFSWKIGICMCLLSNSAAAYPYQNQTWLSAP